jgi:hypothetical protein
MQNQYYRVKHYLKLYLDMCWTRKQGKTNAKFAADHFLYVRLLALLALVMGGS